MLNTQLKVEKCGTAARAMTLVAGTFKYRPISWKEHGAVHADLDERGIVSRNGESFP